MTAAADEMLIFRICYGCSNAHRNHQVGYSYESDRQATPVSGNL